MMVWTATVFFGWHYIVDGPVGVAMMLSIWMLAKAIAARAYPEESVDAGETFRCGAQALHFTVDEDDSEDWQAGRAA